MHRRPVDQQDLDHVGMVLPDRPHHGGLAAGAADFRVGPVGEQQPNHVGGAGARRHHQRGFAREQRPVRGGPRLEQRRDQGGAAVLAGRPQRRHPEVGRRVHVGPGPQQPPDDLRIVAVARPVQRGGAVGGGGRNARAAVEQRCDPRRIALLGGVDEGRRLGKRNGSRGGQHCRGDEDADSQQTHGGHLDRSGPCRATWPRPGTRPRDPCTGPSLNLAVRYRSAVFRTVIETELPTASRRSPPFLRRGAPDTRPGCFRQCPYNSPVSVSTGSAPVLPPIRSTGTSILSIRVTSRFAIEGSSV